MPARPRTVVAGGALLAAAAGAATAAAVAGVHARRQPEPLTHERHLDIAYASVQANWMEALLAREARVAGGPFGPATTTLYERLTPEDLAELERRLDDEQRKSWERTHEQGRQRMAVVLAIHHELPGALERLGLSAAVPPEHVHAMARGPYAAGGDPYIADVVLSGFEDAGFTLGPGATVLDFGSSSGRALRTVAAVRPDLQCIGCDPNSGAIAWASEHLPMARFFESPTAPPLPLDNGSVDAVYAISIWSHFAEGAALRWLEEMRRVIRPGGALLLTTHGFDTLAEFLRRDLIDKHDAMSIARTLVAGNVTFIDVFGEEGDWGVKDPEWGNSYLTVDWLAEQVTPEWAIRLSRPGGLDGVQDVIVLERRG